MQIKRVYRKNRELDNTTFTSFKEVFDYCLNDLAKSASRGDCVMYRFKILDTDETFNVVGHPNGEDSTISTQVEFRMQEEIKCLLIILD